MTSVAATCRAAGFTPPVEVSASDFPAVTGFVATGEYVSVQPSLIAAEARPDVVAVPLRAPAPTRRVQMRVRRSLEANPAVRFLMERVRAITLETAVRIPGVTAL